MRIPSSPILVLVPALSACSPEPLERVGNRAPDLALVEALPATVPAGAHTRLRPQYYDPEGVPPLVKWEVAGGAGTLIEEAQEAVWRAPEEPGAYPLTLTLCDGDAPGAPHLTVTSDDLPDPPVVRVCGPDEDCARGDHAPVVLAVLARVRGQRAWSRSALAPPGTDVELLALVEDVDGDAPDFVWSSTFARGGFVDAGGDLAGAIATEADPAPAEDLLGDMEAPDEPPCPEQTGEGCPSCRSLELAPDRLADLAQGDHVYRAVARFHVAEVCCPGVHQVFVRAPYPCGDDACEAFGYVTVSAQGESAL